MFTVHQNYIGVDGAREPYLLSVVQEGGAGLLRAILFNKMVSFFKYTSAFMASLYHQPKDVNCWTLASPKESMRPIPERTF